MLSTIFEFLKFVAIILLGVYGLAALWAWFKILRSGHLHRPKYDWWFELRSLGNQYHATQVVHDWQKVALDKAALDKAATDIARLKNYMVVVIVCVLVVVVAGLV